MSGEHGGQSRRVTQFDFQGTDLLGADLPNNDLQNKGEIERLHPASFAWALLCCDHRREEAEEVLQIAYLKLLEGTARFDGRSSLRTWFFGVIRRTAWEQRRRRWLRGQILERRIMRELSPSQAPDPETAAGAAQSNAALRAALTHLPRRQREVLHLVFYQELTIEEASGILGIGLGTARTHFERGKARLRKIFVEEGTKRGIS